MRKWRSVILAFGLVVVLPFSPIPGIGLAPARSEEPKGEEKVELSKGKRAQAFLAAFNRGDARAVAAFWTPDGDYVDQVGHKHKGRAALEKLYEKVFAGNKGAKLTLTITSHKLLSPEVALQEGTTQVAPADGGPPTAGAFSAVLVKKDGEWYFESVRESPVYPPSNVKHFEDLEWLIGDWQGEGDKAESSVASYHWAENQNFIVSTFATTLKGIPVVGGTQWIAWDAVEKKVRSWSFYSGGGFGEATWTKDGDKWVIKTKARTAAGKEVSVMHIVTKQDNDHTTWQITGLTVDGKKLPDPAPQKLKRVKEE
jgi:uncharacterized protein (TIGR02246 family)